MNLLLVSDRLILEESYNYHRVLFDVFNRHIKKVTGTVTDICPVT